MIGQPVADAGAVDERGDPDATQVIGRTDTRQLKQLWGAEGAGAHHDRLVGESLLLTSPAAVLDTDSATVADDDPTDLGLGDDSQILLAVQVGARRGPALAVVD